MKNASPILVVLLILQFFLPNLTTYSSEKSDVEDPSKLAIELVDKSKTKLTWQIMINKAEVENDGTTTTVTLDPSFTHSIIDRSGDSTVEENKDDIEMKTKPDNDSYFIMLETAIANEEVKEIVLEAKTEMNGTTYVAKKEVDFLGDAKSDEKLDKNDRHDGNKNAEKEKSDEQRTTKEEKDQTSEKQKEENKQETYVPLEVAKGAMQDKVVTFSKENESGKQEESSISHEVKEIKSENACYRNIAGEITFTLPTPEERKPVDIVVAQDASGSYAGNARQAKQSLKDIVDHLDLEKDRMLVTSFKGYKGWYSYLTIDDFYDGEKYLERSRPWAEQDLALLDHTGLSNDADHLKRKIDQITFDGATPSASGLLKAKETYEKATAEEDTSDRKTIFIFITDGVANVQLDGYIHIKHNNDGFFGGHVWSERHQFYKPTFDQVLQVANDIKTKGYEIVTAYWENRAVLIKGYGRDYYDNMIGPAAHKMVKDVASDPSYSISNEDLAEMIDGLLTNLERAINTYDGFQAEFVVAPGFELVKDSVRVNGTKVDYTENGNTVTVTLDEIKSGESTVTYELKETATHPSATKPISNGTISYDKDRHSYKNFLKIHQANLKGNKNSHNCQEEVKKFVAFSENDAMKEELSLAKLHDEFTYKLEYQFDGDIGEANEVVLQDELDDVLQVVGTADDINVKTDNIDNFTLDKKVLDEQKGIQLTIQKQNDSYDYLAGKKVTILLHAKVRDDVKNDELKRYEDGAIPNMAELRKDHDVTTSNKVFVRVPQRGSITIHKVNETNDSLQGAHFTLIGPDRYKKTKVSNENGVIEFKNLPLGTYTLKEIEAPEGHRLLQEEITIDITEKTLHVEKEIENTSIGWDLPQTGGIGTVGFYVLGLFMMSLSALYYKRKRLHID